MYFIGTGGDESKLQYDSVEKIVNPKAQTQREHGWSLLLLTGLLHPALGWAQPRAAGRWWLHRVRD